MNPSPSEKDADAQVDENAPLGDRSNMVFSGCSVTYGTATAVVTGTGMDTEMGKIAGLLEGEEETQTPLQQKLAQLGKYLGIVALAACRHYLCGGLLSGMEVLEIFNDGRFPGGFRHSRGPAGHRHYCAGHRRAADGQEKRP